MERSRASLPSGSNPPKPTNAPEAVENRNKRRPGSSRSPDGSEAASSAVLMAASSPSGSGSQLIETGGLRRGTSVSLAKVIP